MAWPTCDLLIEKLGRKVPVWRGSNEAIDIMAQIDKGRGRGKRVRSPYLRCSH